MFADTDSQAKLTRDPVAPAERSTHALAKVGSHTLADGTTARSFSTLLAELATIVRNTCRTSGSSDTNTPTLDITTTPNPKQVGAIERLRTITV